VSGRLLRDIVVVIRRRLYRVSRMQSRLLLSRQRCCCRRRTRARIRSAARIRAPRCSTRICVPTKVPQLLLVVFFLVFFIQNMPQPLRRRRPRTIIRHKRRWRTRGDTSALTPTATPRKPFKLVPLFQRKRSSSGGPFHLPALVSACAALCTLGFLLCIVRRMRRNSRRV
jgi:hypothetical protein